MASSRSVNRDSLIRPFDQALKGDMRAIKGCVPETTTRLT